MISIIEDRVKRRMNDEDYNMAAMGEISQTVMDRLMIRLGVTSEKTFPASFYGICAEASVKAYRRKYYEGIKTESVGGTFSNTFVDDILSEYAEEIASYHNSDTGGSTKRVRFL